MLAAAEGHVGTCRLLLASGAEAHLLAADGRDALALATERGHQSVCSLLRERPAPGMPGLLREAPPSADEEALLADGLPSSSWEEVLEDESAPAGHDSWVPASLQTQRQLSAHTPFDASEDWSEVDLALPSSLYLEVFGEDRVAALRLLLRRGLVNGILPAAALETVAEGETPDGLETHHLLQVIGDIGIAVAEIHDDEAPEAPEDEDDGLERTITDALNCLASLASTTGDELRDLYMKAVRALRRPPPEHESAWAFAYRSGLAECVRAVSTSPPVKAALLALSLDPVTTGALAVPDEYPDHTGPIPPEPVETLPDTADRSDPGSDGTLQVETPSPDAIRGSTPGFHVLARLNDTVSWPPGHEEAHRRFVTSLGEAAMARQRLIEGHLWLVAWLARRYAWSDLPLLDLIQEGNIGLIRAVETFDPSRGARLSTYAAWSIRMAISHAIPDQARTIRYPQHLFNEINALKRSRGALTVDLGRAPTSVELADRVGIPTQRVHTLIALEKPMLPLPAFAAGAGNALEDSLEDDSGSNPEEAVLAADRYRALALALARLKPRDRQVLRLRYGLGGGEELTLEEVGRILSVTRERVRQIEGEARKALGKILMALWAPHILPRRGAGQRTREIGGRKDDTSLA